MMRGRYAPTPSGPMHIGNAAAALTAWLHARQNEADFLLRIEDLDRPRCRAEWTEQLIGDLRWLGFDWDEGPDVGGPVGPYAQSERNDFYDAALRELDGKGLLYPCFCSRAELMAVASAPHGLSAEGPAYPGTCRGLSEAERERRRARKEPSLRFRMPDEAIAFRDLAAGTQRADAGAGGDFVVRRADGIVAYQLAVVVDDAAMGITHVVRGWDLLDSTPRQLALYRALGLPAPQFAHVPLLLGPDGARLSKRDRSQSIAALREAGVSPQAAVGWLAHALGLIDRFEPASPRDLIGRLRLDHLPLPTVRIGEAPMRKLAENDL